MDAECTLGPMSSIKQRDDLHQQVMNSVGNGCTIEMGGYIPNLEGAFYPPTILTNITKDAPAYKEEFFGPVALVFKVKNINEAVALFNDTSFGLGGGIYSQDEDTATHIAETLLQAGSVNINSCVSSDPRMPFGGIKESGYGRELAHFGIYEFSNIKSIVL
jgi:succinate-semialdehyde dehydrogenase/glutarate-semialdehyde dehydrogenase